MCVNYKEEEVEKIVAERILNPWTVSAVVADFEKYEFAGVIVTCDSQDSEGEDEITMNTFKSTSLSEVLDWMRMRTDGWPEINVDRMIVQHKIIPAIKVIQAAVKKWLRKEEKASHRRCIDRCSMIFKELMAATWHPTRMCAWCLDHEDEFVAKLG